MELEALKQLLASLDTNPDEIEVKGLYLSGGRRISAGQEQITCRAPRPKIDQYTDYNDPFDVFDCFFR